MQVVIVLVVVGFVALAALGLYVPWKRRKELEEWAASRGLRFSAAKQRGLDARFSGFSCLSQGYGRYADNIISGAWAGRCVVGFDYHYTTGSGKNEQHHSFSAVITQSLFPLKPLFIRRESIFDKVTEFFGFDDIDFESAEFSRRFYVKAPDRRWAYDVIHQRMMEFLLAAPEFDIQFDNAHVMVWRSGRRFNAADFEAAMEFTRGLFDRMPEYLVRQQHDQGC